MKPFLHAKSSAKKYGGSWEDYMDLHEFLDQSKQSLGDMRHRMFLHNTMGIYIGQQVFGAVRTNSAGRQYSVRDVLEDHCLEDLGAIFTLENWVQGVKIQPWFGGRPRRKVESKVIYFSKTGDEDGEKEN